MARASRDDAAADEAARLYDRLGPALYRYALMILGDASDAEDAVHDVFLAVVRTRGRDRANDDAYWYRAVRNQCFSALRRRVRQPVSDAPLVEALHVPAESVEERMTLDRAIRMLPPEQREVVHLKVFEGRTFQEIADLLNESINTIASRYRYAVDKLRVELGIRR